MKYTCLINFNYLRNIDPKSLGVIPTRYLISKVSNMFNITLNLTPSNNSGYELDLKISYEVDAENKDEAEKKVTRFVDKLNLLASIEEGKNIRPFQFSYAEPAQYLNLITHMDNPFYDISPKQLECFLEDSNETDLFLLFEAFRNLNRNEIFDAFPKFVNWLDTDDYDNALHKKFCAIRNALSHTKLDTAEKVKKLWPKLKFEGNKFVRDKSNKEQLIILMPGLLNMVKDRFHKILYDSTNN